MEKFAMDLTDLLVFSKVAEFGGVSRAAEQLHRVPSNVTARIQKLERELGQELFVRDKNRLYISPAGEQLREYAKQILALAQEAVDQLNQPYPRGKLRLGTMEAVAATRLADVLMAYHRQYPEVTLEVHTDPTGVLIEQVIRGDLDLALVADPVADERLRQQPVFQESLVIVSENPHPDISTPLDLGPSPTLLGFSSRCAYRTRLTHWLGESRMAARVVEINSYHAMLNCVTAGMGVGIVPEILLQSVPFAAGLKKHALPARWRDTTTCLIWRKDAEKPSMDAFKTLIAEFANVNPK
ncbi:MAG: LysR substrate-binding domain-containing protein [Pseudomonadales bacterium]|nr:LysR substrate-binding domain-containing protein [Pseudomonadales bacterium]